MDGASSPLTSAVHALMRLTGAPPCRSSGGALLPRKSIVALVRPPQGTAEAGGVWHYRVLDGALGYSVYRASTCAGRTRRRVRCARPRGACATSTASARAISPKPRAQRRRRSSSSTSGAPKERCATVARRRRRDSVHGRVACTVTAGVRCAAQIREPVHRQRRRALRRPFAALPRAQPQRRGPIGFSSHERRAHTALAESSAAVYRRHSCTTAPVCGRRGRDRDVARPAVGRR